MRVVEALGIIDGGEEGGGGDGADAGDGAQARHAGSLDGGAARSWRRSSLAACEGALLLVDATQGVEAQTIANAYLAIANNLHVIPVINKIDLPSADIEGVEHQIHEVLGLDVTDALLVSAKEGRGVREVLEAIITRFLRRRETRKNR